MERGALAADAVGFIGESVHAAGVDPAIVEIEHGADGDGEIDSVVLPTHCVERQHIFGRDARRVAIHFIDEAEEGFMLLVKPGGFEIAEHAPDQVFVAQQFGRDRGVRLESKRAIIAIGGVSGDQFADAWAEGARTAQNFLRETGQMIGGPGHKGEHMPDLRILGLAVAHHADHVRKGSRLGVLFHAGQKHRLHRWVLVRHERRSRTSELSHVSLLGSIVGKR